LIYPLCNAQAVRNGETLVVNLGAGKYKVGGGGGRRAWKWADPASVHVPRGNADPSVLIPAHVLAAQNFRLGQRTFACRGDSVRTVYPPWKYPVLMKHARQRTQGETLCFPLSGESLEAPRAPQAAG